MFIDAIQDSLLSWVLENDLIKGFPTTVVLLAAAIFVQQKCCRAIATLDIKQPLRNNIQKASV